MFSWTVDPLVLGSFDRQKSKFVYGKGVGEQITLPFVSWLLRSDEHTVLIDSGPCNPDTSLPFHHPFSVEPEETLPQALAQLDVSLEEVDTIVLTHLHWDHCFNTELFPQAKVYVQREELRYAIAPLPIHVGAYEAITAGYDPPWAHIPFEIVEGDVELLPGLRLIFTPGHSPGCQSAVVDTAKERYVLCGDTIPRIDNLAGSDHPMEWLPSGLYVNMEDYYWSFERIAAAGGIVIPGHDKAAFELL